LGAFYWRDEILQVMYWMRGEGLSDAPSAAELAPFLATEAPLLETYLQQMLVDGFITQANGAGVPRYALTERGRQDGGRLFEEEFAGLTNQGHGECNDPNCECKTLGPEACVNRQPSH
jgi:hypothetical protein